MALRILLRVMFLRLALPCFLWCQTTAALANSPTSDVGSAAVDDEASTMEFRFGYGLDARNPSLDERLRSRVHYDHGFTDHYALRLIVAQDKREGDRTEHDSVTMEHRFQLFERKIHGWDGGFRISYQHKDGDKKPDQLAVGLLAKFRFAEHWEFRQNSFFSHEIGTGSNDGVALELRHQLTRAVGSVRLGVELFQDFGFLNELHGYDRQSHQAGPVIKGKIADALAYQIGYRAGLSEDEADHSVRFYLSRSF